MAKREKGPSNRLDLGETGGEGVVILPDQAGRIQVRYESFPKAPSPPREAIKAGLAQPRRITYPEIDEIRPENWRRHRADVSKLISQALRAAGNLDTTRHDLRAMLQELDGVQAYDQFKELLGHWQARRLDSFVRDLHVPEGSHQSVPYVRLSVDFDHRENRLNFQLGMFAARVQFEGKPAGFRDLRRSPEEYMRNVFKRLDDLVQERTGADNAEIERRLGALGRNLFDSIFSPALKREYIRFYETTQALWIVSNESWITWELIRPYPDPGMAGRPEDRGFLCDVFNLLHWLPARECVSSAEVGPSCCVVLGEGLPAAQRERRYIIKELTSAHRVDSVAEPKTASEVLSLLSAQRFGLIHFACGCRFYEEEPGRSWLKLGDETILRPVDLKDPSVTENIRSSRPIVLMNACHAGRMGWGLANLEGWAAAFIESGCSVFIAPMWKVRDDLAAEFAIELYSNLSSGEPVARAVSLARRKVRSLAVGNPTWLAYRVYADPRCYIAP